MRTHKPTLRQNGQLMIDIKVRFSVELTDVENIFLYGIYLKEEMPMNKLLAIQYIKKHLQLFGLAGLFNEEVCKTITPDMERRAAFLARHFFPELVQQ